MIDEKGQPVTARAQDSAVVNGGRCPATGRLYFQVLDGYLTAREAEICWHLSRGCTVKGAALCVGLSARTVEFYVGNIRRRMDLFSKSQLLQLLFDDGFFSRHGIEYDACR